MSKNILYRFALSKIIVIVLCALLFGALIISLSNDAFAFVKPTQSITFTREQPTDLYELSLELQSAGVIENGFSFWIYAKYKNAQSILEDFYGSIELDSAMSYRDIINQFKNF